MDISSVSQSSPRNNNIQSDEVQTWKRYCLAKDTNKEHKRDYTILSVCLRLSQNEHIT